MTLPAPPTAQILRQASIIAHLLEPSHPAELSEIADALLAAPVTAVAVAVATVAANGDAQALKAIAALRQRVSGHMAVGASQVLTSTQVDQVVAAGAQYVLSPFFHAGIAARTAALKVLYVPGIFSTSEAEAAYAAGYTLLCYTPADLFGPTHLETLREVVPAADFLAEGAIAAGELAEFVRAGAVGLLLDAALFPTSRLTQERIITQARTLQRLWERTQR